MSAGRAARGRRHADAARDRGAALGPPLPLHGLRVDRGCHRRGRGDRGVNLGEHLLACAERHPEALALVDGERRATYAELLADARAAAGGLAARGVAPGRSRRGGAQEPLRDGRPVLGLAVAGRRLRAAQLAPATRRADLLRGRLRRARPGDRGRLRRGRRRPCRGMPLIAVADAPAGEPLAAVDGPGGAVAVPTSASRR